MTTPNPAAPKPNRTTRVVIGVIAGLALAACCGFGISAINSSDTTDNTSTSVAPTGPSDDQVKQDALAYKVCPGKEGDTLQSALAAVFTIANDTPKGSDVIDRSGNHARISVQYIEDGQEKKTDFEYDLTTHEVTGADDVAVNTLKALKAECPGS